MADEIMRELWSVKDAIGEEADYDLDKLAELLKERQAERAKKEGARRALDKAPDRLVVEGDDAG